MRKSIKNPEFLNKDVFIYKLLYFFFILGSAGLFVLHFVVFGRNLGCNEESFPQVKLKKFKESYLV